MATCKRCAGNGEVVVDWDAYLHPRPDVADEDTVAECADCGGTGIVDDGTLVWVDEWPAIEAREAQAARTPGTQIWAETSGDDLGESPDY